MAGGTGARGLEAAGARVRDVALVVGGVDVFAIPAAASPLVWLNTVGNKGNERWEGNRGPDATGAELVRKRGRVLARAGRPAKGGLLDVVLAAVADLLLHGALVADGRVADEHAEALTC